MASTTDSLTTQPAPLALHGSPSPQSSRATLQGPTTTTSSGSSSSTKAPRPDASKSGSGTLNETLAAGTLTTATAGTALNGTVPDITSPHELMVFVEDVLGKLEVNFDNVSNQVLERLEAISKKIDTVEQNISDLMQGNMSIESSTSTPAATAATSTGAADGSTSSTTDKST